MSRGTRLNNLRHVPWLLGELLRSGPRVARMEQELDRLHERTARLETNVDREVRPVLRALVSEQAENRRRLYALRASSEYEQPFTGPDPLVTVTVATRGRPGLLKERSLPSILAQTHANIELIVVGDEAGPETAEAVASMNDDRVSFRDLTQRIVADEDWEKHWLVSSAMARNEAVRTARGLWLVPFDDDDAMRPDHVERLLATAREERVEVAYGKYRTHGEGEDSFDEGEFPPRPRGIAWPAAIQHSGLRFFERELYAASLGLPGDWFLLERMLRAGVRFGFLDEVVLDYFPSRG